MFHIVGTDADVLGYKYLYLALCMYVYIRKESGSTVKPKVVQLPSTFVTGLLLILKRHGKSVPWL